LGLLPEQSVVGTGSLRRRAQLLYARPDLRVHDIRGNVDTRLRKLGEGGYDAVVLAEAGLQRLGRCDEITQRLRPAVMLPAVGQGALGLETRRNDEAAAAVAALDHPPTHQAVLAERAMLEALEGGCLAPVAAWGRIEDGRLTLTGRVIADDGSRRIEVTQSAEPDAAVQLGLAIADDLLAMGAAGLIAASRETV
jgi:hydroxymethylbilane synthase